MNWHEAAARIRWNIQPFIDGRYQASRASESFDTLNPATETALCTVSVGAASDVDAAVAAARRSFADGRWSRLPASRRADILRRLADLMARDENALALFDTLEMGKPIAAALTDAGTLATGFLRACAGFADKLVGMSAPLEAASVALNTYEPRGVVAAITPWNFPVLNAVVKIAPALAAGNAVVLKPSELTASSALRVAELALEAGLPEGVLNVVPGLGATVGAALAAHPDVDLVSFTGSTATGRRIMELAARSNGKPVLLECGGKSPQVVFGDVDQIATVSNAIVQGIVVNQGQMCSARTRLIVHEAIKEQLLEQVVRGASAYTPGDPLDPATNFGSLASPAQRDRVKGFIDLGIEEGAEPVLQGSVQMHQGCNVSPTIFDGVSGRMTIARAEIFGPVLCVLSFASDDEALLLANDTEYGLAATVWTRDMGRAKRMAREINAGNILIRTSGAEAPSSGYILGHEPRKASGFGAELGLPGLQSYSTLKSVTFTGA